MAIFNGTRKTVSPGIIYFILDVEEVLERHEHENYTSTERDKRLLKQAMIFLEIAERGEKMLTEGPLVADMVLI